MSYNKEESFGEEIFRLNPVLFEICIRDPSFFIKKALGYGSLEFKGMVWARDIN